MMRRGAWHQCGHQSQILIGELMQAGVGVGAILSPKDLSLDNARRYAEQYRSLGMGILFDPQFYQPEFAAGRLGTYPTLAFRQSIGALGALPPGAIAGLAQAIEDENRELGSDAVIAPAIPYEAARPDIIDLNALLFEAAKAAGDAIGIPTFSTVVLSDSATNEGVVSNILSSATALNADGWYFGFEFDAQQRLPTDSGAVYRYCSAGLTLAGTGKPVLHAYAGPLSLVAYGAGARAVGLGIWQNLWGFTRSRFQQRLGSGGGGDAPPRYFSAPLWGTVIYPDEFQLLAPPLRAQITQHSPYSQNISPGVAWSKRLSQKHMIHILVEQTNILAQMVNARQAMNSAVATLNSAAAIHSAIRASGIRLKDNTDTYQSPWASAGATSIIQNSNDYDWLEMVGGP
jgi:hypothetical protein